jgi:DNA repair exonuclease SbcCD ATPase subunit
MGNEKFVNYYIENLIATMNDCLIRNISLQVNERISKEAIEDQAKVIEDLKDTIGSLQKENQSIQDNKLISDQEKYQNLENSIKEHLDTIKGLNERITEADKLKNEYENVKHQVQHVDTFRNELSKTREEFDNSKNNYENTIKDLKNNYENTIKELKNGNENAIRDLKNGHENVIKELTDKIDYLQLTPAKRKKLDDDKVSVTPIENTLEVFTKSDITKDGGSF